MEQSSLFESGEWWEEYWQDMPEFDQRDLTAEKSLIVNFKSLDDMNRFSELVGQPITTRTRSIWYPAAEIGRYADKVYLAS